ncbi:MAG: hypothetical protein K8F25_13810, partial [Fimbriimonadaceae bacterium]|nr:hypothetical protein [Alphaproteobacteria bacterium]
LEAMCALPHWNKTLARPDDLPAAAILVSGIFELEPLIGTSVNEALGLDKNAARANSPLLKELCGFPPTLVACGRVETDEFMRQSYAFASALAAAGTPVRTMIAENRNHFDVILDLANPATSLGQQAETLIQIVKDL